MISSLERKKIDAKAKLQVIRVVKSNFTFISQRRGKVTHIENSISNSIRGNIERTSKFLTFFYHQIKTVENVLEGRVPVQANHASCSNVSSCQSFRV